MDAPPPEPKTILEKVYSAEYDSKWMPLALDGAFEEIDLHLQQTDLQRLIQQLIHYYIGNRAFLWPLSRISGLMSVWVALVFLIFSVCVRCCH